MTGSSNYPNMNVVERRTTNGSSCQCCQSELGTRPSFEREFPSIVETLLTLGKVDLGLRAPVKPLDLGRVYEDAKLVEHTSRE